MKPWLILFSLLITLSGCTAQHLEIFPDLSDPKLMTKKLTVVQMHEDIDALISGAKARHPALENYADLQQLDIAAEELKQTIRQPLNRTDFYRYIGRLTHLFNDGHSLLIWPYQEYKQLSETGNKPFPFEVAITEDEKILMKHHYSNGDMTIAAGTEIVAINGHSSPELLAHLQQYVGGETLYLRTQVVAHRFGLSLWAAMGFVNNFEVQVLQNQKPAVLVVTKAQNWLKQSQNDASNTAWYYKKLSARAGLLYLDHFDIDPGEFEDDIDDTFAQIRREEIRHLIIDIRQNPGGNTDTVTYLSRYLADKPFRLVSSMREKLHQDNRGWFNQRGNIGDILTQHWDDWEKPMKPGKRFSGDVYLLTSAISYSSAIVLATTLKDHDFATLVGETTGGFANQTAQGNLFNLPHSELRAYIATRLLVRPNGKTQRSGVVPHVEVSVTAEDIARQNDAVLNKTLNIIANKESVK